MVLNSSLFKEVLFVYAILIVVSELNVLTSTSNGQSMLELLRHVCFLLDLCYLEDHIGIVIEPHLDVDLFVKLIDAQFEEPIVGARLHELGTFERLVTLVLTVLADKVLLDTLENVDMLLEPDTKWTQLEDRESESPPNQGLLHPCGQALVHQSAKLAQLPLCLFTQGFLLLVEPLLQERGSPVEHEVPPIVGAADRVSILQLGLVEAMSLEQESILGVDYVVAARKVDSDEGGDCLLVVILLNRVSLVVLQLQEPPQRAVVLGALFDRDLNSRGKVLAEGFVRSVEVDPPLVEVRSHSDEGGSGRLHVLRQEGHSVASVRVHDVPGVDNHAVGLVEDVLVVVEHLVLTKPVVVYSLSVDQVVPDLD